MLSEIKLQVFSKKFKALAEPNRLQILQFIQKAESQNPCIKELAAELKIGLPTISHHLKALAEAEIILMQKKGQCTHCRLNPTVFNAFNLFFNSLKI